MHHDPLRCESMLFDYKTTYRTDYRDGEIKNVIKTVYEPKPVKPRPAPIPLKDIQALFPLRDPTIPFNMFHRPKPIIRTSPWIVQETHERPVNKIRHQVQQTRPKVFMTPAICLDTVEEPTRQELVNFVYKSTVMKAMDEAVSMSGRQKNIKAPLSPQYAPARPIKLEPFRQPYVPPEWRMPSVSWDQKQLRKFTDPTKCFWLSRTPNCRACRETATALAHRKLLCQMKLQK